MSSVKTTHDNGGLMCFEGSGRVTTFRCRCSKLTQGVKQTPSDIATRTTNRDDDDDDDDDDDADDDDDDDDHNHR
eukprot:1567269-Amphidinium_carterae.1